MQGRPPRRPLFQDVCDGLRGLLDGLDGERRQSVQFLERVDVLLGSHDRAKADNYAFDEQVSTERQEAFEGFCGSMTDPAALLRRHTDYVSERICEGNPPDTFVPALNPAASGEQDENQPLVRIESLERPIALF